MPRPPEARIQFAKVEPTTIAIADLADAIRESLVPGTATERYERIWRMGQFDEVDNYVFGRIGFEAAGVTELWNADINDFQEARLPAGTTAPFALNLDLGELAFQRRPSKGIRPQSFVGAFQALLNDASAFTSWRVWQESRRVEWGDWVASVDRLTQLRFRLERPNPDWKGRERVEAIIEGANAALMDPGLAGWSIAGTIRLVFQTAWHAERRAQMMKAVSDARAALEARQRQKAQQDKRTARR